MAVVVPMGKELSAGVSARAEETFLNSSVAALPSHAVTSQSDPA